MSKCLTIRLLHETSGCLIATPECTYAERLGFSFICCHPDHARFHVHITGNMTNDEALERYTALKRERRNAFLADLSEEHKSYFSYSNKFHFHSLTEQGQLLNANHES